MKQLKECTFCPGKFHSFKDCPKPDMIRKLDKMGISSVDQIQLKPKAVSKQTSIKLTQMKVSDEYEIACTTVDESDSEDDRKDLVDDSSDDESELKINLLVSDGVSVKEKMEKANLASMLRN